MCVSPNDILGERCKIKRYKKVPEITRRETLIFRGYSNWKTLRFELKWACLVHFEIDRREEKERASWRWHECEEEKRAPPENGKIDLEIANAEQYTVRTATTIILLASLAFFLVLIYLCFACARIGLHI